MPGRAGKDCLVLSSRATSTLQIMYWRLENFAKVRNEDALKFSSLVFGNFRNPDTYRTNTYLLNLSSFLAGKKRENVLKLQGKRNPVSTTIYKANKWTPKKSAQIFSAICMGPF
jgi:hypothetical protein